jgi:hypothetical protein
MRTANLRGFAIVLLPMLATLAGCGPDAMVQPGQIAGGATKQISDVQSVRGFLPQPGLLAPGVGRQPALVYLNPNANFASYTTVMLDPVAIWAAPGSELNSVPSSQRQELAGRFENALYQKLSQNCHVVSTPADKTVILRFALTDANSTNPVVNTVTTYTPYLSTAVSAASLVFNGGVGYFTGTASAEGYATDARTGTLLWQGVDKRGGTGALVKNTLDNWLDVDRAMQDWSTKLTSRLQELGVCRT